MMPDEDDPTLIWPWEDGSSKLDLVDIFNRQDLVFEDLVFEDDEDLLDVDGG